MCKLTPTLLADLVLALQFQRRLPRVRKWKLDRLVNTGRSNRGRPNPAARRYR